MEAEKMFKKLGYEKDKTKQQIMYSKNEEGDYKYIFFNLFDKTFNCQYDYEPANISMEELQAINQQVKDLGW